MVLLADDLCTVRRQTVAVVDLALGRERTLLLREPSLRRLAQCRMQSSFGQ